MSKKRKAPPGMPPEMAKALKLKQPGAPRRNPVAPRDRNPLQYLLARGAEGKGVILSGSQATLLASAFMDTQNWTREVNKQLAEVEVDLDRLAVAWVSYEGDPDKLGDLGTVLAEVFKDEDEDEGEDA